MRKKTQASKLTKFLRIQGTNTNLVKYYPLFLKQSFAQEPRPEWRGPGGRHSKDENWEQENKKGLALTEGT